MTLDTPPADHGSDRYDYAESSGAPAGIVPAGAWWDRLLEQPCPDCRANVFARWRPGNPDVCPDPWARRWWDVSIAHDDGCPFLAQVESGR